MEVDPGTIDVVADFLRSVGHADASQRVLQRFGGANATRPWRGPPSLLRALPDGPLVSVLANLSFAEAATTLGACSKRLLGLRRSRLLLATRGAAPYSLLRGGVVRALATKFGTTAWPEATETSLRRLPGHRLPPPQLKITWMNRNSGGTDSSDAFLRSDLGGEVRDGESAAHFDHNLVAGEGEAATLSSDCAANSQTYAEYELPFSLCCSGFALGFGTCSRQEFLDWSLEARDSLAASGWRTLFSPDVSPFSNDDSHDPLWFQVFDPFESNCFRIVNHRDQQCFHIMSFDLFGTICAPWNAVAVLDEAAWPQNNLCEIHIPRESASNLAGHVLRLEATGEWSDSIADS